MKKVIKKYKIIHWVYGVVVSRSLCMRKASGSIPDISSPFYPAKKKKKNNQLIIYIYYY